LIKLNDMQNHFIRFLLCGKVEISNKEAATRWNQLGLSWLKPPFVVVKIAPVFSSVAFDKKDKSIFEYEQSVIKLLKREGLTFCTLIDEYNTIQVIISMENNDAVLDDGFIRIHEQLLILYGLDLFIGIGSRVDALEKLAISVADAHLMLAYKYQYADRGVVDIENIVRFQNNSNIGPSISFDRVIGCFQDWDLGRMQIRMNELVEEVRNRPNVSKTSIRRTLIELVVRILNVASYTGVDVDDVLEGKDPYYWILSQNHTEVITEWIMELSSQLILRMDTQIDHVEKDTVRQACEFIEEQLMDPGLGLDAISDRVSLSNAYFSQLFKNEIGIGVNNYITNHRVARGKYLLEKSELKMDDIARQCGFASTNYFNRTFKKITGMTPLQYRKSIKIEKK